MKLDLEIPYKLNEADRQQFKTGYEVSALLIRHAVQKKWPENMPRDPSRIWARIQDQILDSKNPLDLSDLEWEWLKELVKECDFPGLLSSWRWTLERHFDKYSNLELVQKINE
jgi:hypothetical protein